MKPLLVIQGEPLRVADSPDGAILAVRVSPRAARSKIAGIREGALVIRLTALPVQGAANAALIELLAGTLGVPRRCVTLLSGGRSRDKRVRIEGLRAADVKTRLTRLVQRESGVTRPPYAG